MLSSQIRRGATPHKELRAGNSVWNGSSVTGVSARRLTESVKVDVVIVGAGISGAFMAHALAPRYKDVFVLDRRAPFTGATSASTAMLQFEIDVPLIKLVDKIGAVKAARAWRRSFRSTQQLIRLVRDERIHCGLQPRNALYLAGNDMGARGLEAECELRNRAGIPGDYLTRTALVDRFGIDRTAAILSPKSAIANPTQLAAGLLRRAVASGARIYSPVNVENVIATAHGVILDTGRHFLEAKHAIFCTGYETLTGLPPHGSKITSSWAIATAPRTQCPPWLDKTVIWEAATPYLYLRTTPDGRIIAGGEDEDIDLPSYRGRSLTRKSGRLVSKVEALIPSLKIKATHQWTGAFGESADGLPFIDHVPDMPGCIAVMGFGGNGTIYSMIASQIVPTLLSGRREKDAALFEFRT